jgi:hypothetical protein
VTCANNKKELAKKNRRVLLDIDRLLPRSCLLAFLDGLEVATHKCANVPAAVAYAVIDRGKDVPF